MKFVKENAYLLIILLFGIVLRVWKLDLVPISLFGDEIDVGIQANSILVSGRDYFSNFLPVIFHSFSTFNKGLNVLNVLLPVADN